MITGPIIAEIAARAGDPARATMVSALLDGRALTASELAFAARITPQTASTHLTKLTEAGLLAVVRNGRHRYFRLASPTVVDMIDGIVAVALQKRPRYRPLSGQARALRAARICYDHLAGRLSVDLTDSFIAREYVVLDYDVASRRRRSVLPDASITVEVLIGASDRFACNNRGHDSSVLMMEIRTVGVPSAGGGHAGGENAHPAGRRRDASGRPARNARGTARAPGRAALSLPFLRA